MYTSNYVFAYFTTEMEPARSMQAVKLQHTNLYNSPFFLVNGVDSSPSAVVLERVVRRLRPLDPALGNVNRQVASGCNGASHQA